MQNPGYSSEQERLVAMTLARHGITRGDGQQIAPCVVKDGEYPLSSAQERLWFMEKMLPASGAYNIPLTLHVGDRVDPAALQQAVDIVVARHAMLRTAIVERNGEPVQKVDADARVPVVCHDVSDLASDAREVRVSQLAEAHARAPFDIARAPLMRVALVQSGDAEAWLLLAVHHIATDGASLGILRDELLHAYRALVAGHAVELPDVPLQYGDFAHWQRQGLHADGDASLRRFWAEALSGAPAGTALPADRQRSAIRQAPPAGAFEVMLPASLRDNLHRHASAQGASLFMICLAGFAGLLSRVSGQSDVVVGTPSGTRERPELEGMVGLLVNPLALRCDLTDEPSLDGLLAAVRGRVLDAFAHQALPFEQVVEATGAGRHPHGMPLFNVMFSLAQDGRAPTGPDLRELAVGPLASAKYDLTVVLVDQPAGMRMEVEYATDIFDRGTVERLAAHYVALLEAALASPQVPLAHLPLAGADEVRELTAWGQGATVPSAVPALERFEAHAAATPDAMAVVADGVTVSYGQLDVWADRIAHALVHRGVRPGQVVALATGRGASRAAGMLGALKAGAAFLPLDTAHPAERLGWQVDDAQAQAVLVDGAQAPAWTGVVSVDIAALADGETLPRVPRVPRDDGGDGLAYVIHTSGSTGRPKGVEVGTAALANLVQWYGGYLGIGAGDRLSQVAGAAFDAALLEWWGALGHGASVHVADESTRADPEALVAWLTREAITIAFLPTPLAERALVQAWPASMALRHMVTGGDRLRQGPPAGLPFMLHNAYGPTEAAVVTTCGVVPAQQPGQLVPSIGKVIDGADVQVVDAQGVAVPVGVVGELWIGGAGLARGYRGQPAQTAERFVPHPWHPDRRAYRTGDRVRYRPDGTLEFLGRQDDQVKIRGVRIELGEITQALSSAPGVLAAAAGVVQDEDRPALAAWVQLERGSTIDGVHAWLQTVLPLAMLPAVMQSVDALPMTPNGKVDTKALVATHSAKLHAEVWPLRTETEQVVARIWSEVLGHAVDNGSDNFFALGGHSLLAARVASRLSQELGTDVPLHSLFEATTVTTLAAGIDARRWNGSALGAPPIEALARIPGAANTFVQSHAQQRLWFLQQMEPDSPAYNVHSLHMLRGELDIQALQSSLDALVARHEILRTTFHMQEDGRLVQVVAPVGTVALGDIDLRGMTGDLAAEAARQAIRTDMEAPFDLSAGPLLRVSVLRSDDDERALLVGMHHIVTDAWSMDVLLRELSALYAACRQGLPDPLPPLAIQYADYATWHDEWINYGVLEELQFFWQEHLRGAPSDLALPADRQRDGHGKLAGATVPVRLSPSLTHAVKRYADASGATPFMVLLAGYKAMLSRASGQDDIVVGVPVANRTHQELESLAGFFVNTLVLRTDLSSGCDFHSAVGRVRDTTLQGFAHQQLPLERLIQRLSHERRWQRSPLFRTMFALQNAPATPLRLDGLEVSTVPLAPRTAKFDLTVALAETANGLEGVFEYATDIFDRGTVERLAAHYVALLEAALASPQVPLAHLPLAGADEVRELTAWGQGATVPSAVPALERFEAHAAATPDAMAVVADGVTVSYGQLDAWADRIAHALVHRGVRPGQVVALATGRGASRAAGMLGALKAGAAFLPLDTAHPAERLGWQVDDAQAQAVLVDGAQAPAWTGVVSVDIAALADGETLPRVPRDDGGDGLAYVIHTSGSTGRPKGVEVGTAALANLVQWYGGYLGIGAGDRLSQVAGAAFDAALLEWWGALGHGASVHVADESTRADPDALVAWLTRKAITIAFLPTPLAERALVQAWPASMALRHMVTGGDRLRQGPPAGLPFTLHNAYGPTEAAVVTTCGVVPAQQPGQLVPSIGKVIDGADVQVVDAQGAAVPVGVVGELWIGGAGLARGYRGQPAQTAERFVPHPWHPDRRAYRTGDRVRYRPDGTLEFLGRQDDQVKIRGVRIELGEITQALLDLEGVRHALTVVRDDGDDPQLVSYVVCEPGTSDDTSTLMPPLRARLPEYMLPVAIVRLESLPTGRNGKIDTAALPRPTAAAMQGTSQVVAARDMVEQELVGIWESVLAYAPAGINHNFFKFGGHSLNALTLRARIEQRLGVRIELMTLFQDGTILDLAKHVRALRAQAGISQQLPVQTDAVTTVAQPAWWRRLLARLKPSRHTPRGADGRPEVTTMDLTAEGTPLFLVQSIGGGVLCYADLAGQLKGALPLYGLRAPEQYREASVQDMARAYVEAMRQVRPQGPYALCGWSLGGVIAFEIARQLEASGETVSGLFMLDSYPFDARYDEADLDRNELLESFVRDLMLTSGQEFSADWFGNVEIATQDDAAGQALHVLQGLAVLPREFTRAEFDARVEAYAANYRAWAAYVPSPCRTRLNLFASAHAINVHRRNPAQQWAGVAINGVEATVVEGDHYSMLRRESAQLIAQSLAKSMSDTVFEAEAVS